MYLSKSKAKKPPWVDCLEQGFGELEEIKENENFSAVLIVRIVYDKPRFLAFTFVVGRFLLKPNSYVPEFGLRTSLNAIYQAEDSTKEVPPARLKAVDSKIVSYNILYNYIQADRDATFDTFGFDVQSDILKGIKGSPTDNKTWGTRVSGADSLHLNPLISLEKIGELCKKVEKFYQSRYYEEIFGWLGNVKAIDKGLIPELESQLEMKLKNYKEDIGNLELAPPEIVNWDQIAYFKFSSIPEEEYYELELLPFLDTLERKGKLSKLSIKQLRSYQRIEAVDVNNEKISEWPVFRCLSGEIKYNNKTYLITDGDFFELNDDYIEELNKFISDLRESTKKLLPAKPDMNEGEYNELAAKDSDYLLLLDKKTVRVESKTTPIEICDIFSDDGNFIHVKRKLGSSSLNHLFGQGYVSGDLFLMDQKYRKAVLKKITEAENDRANCTDDKSFLGRFSTFSISGISPGDFEIVYAIIAEWNGRILVDAMPFFSKINLRRFVMGLKRMGYNVSYLRVPIQK